MQYPDITLLPIDIHFIKENLTDRIQVKNIAGLSMQEICVDITDLVKERAEFNLLDGHKIYFTFNQLSRLSDPETKERVLAKSYPNAMRILADEVFHILHNYTTIPGSIYELFMIEMLDGAFITTHEFDNIGDHTYEYDVVVKLFNDVMDKIPSELKLMTYANTDFKSLGVMNTMQVTSYNKAEVSKWIYDSLDSQHYIVDLRENIPVSNVPISQEFIVINHDNEQYIIRTNDVIIKTDTKIYIVYENIFKELFIPTPYGKYDWDKNIGSVIRRNESFTSYYHYDIIGMVPYVNIGKDSLVTEDGNWQYIDAVVPIECIDHENYPEIYIDDSKDAVYKGLVNMNINTAGLLKLPMKFDINKLTYKYVINWSEDHSDTVVFDATPAVLLTQEETDKLPII